MTPETSPAAQRAIPATNRESERGQALVMVVLFLFVLLGTAAMVIDVGYAYYAIFIDIAADIAKGTSVLIDNDVS
ncbi:MAG TPA: hypothetical protein VFL61_01460 [Gaiellaceae bacterium]|nr:hypothetical protein [Gaiellaceae bacterium]